MNVVLYIIQLLVCRAQGQAAFFATSRRFTRAARSASPKSVCVSRVGPVGVGADARDVGHHDDDDDDDDDHNAWWYYDHDHRHPDHRVRGGGGGGGSNAVGSSFLGSLGGAGLPAKGRRRHRRVAKPGPGQARRILRDHHTRHGRPQRSGQAGAHIRGRGRRAAVRGASASGGVDIICVPGSCTQSAALQPGAPAGRAAAPTHASACRTLPGNKGRKGRRWLARGRGRLWLVHEGAEILRAAPGPSAAAVAEASRELQGRGEAGRVVLPGHGRYGHGWLHRDEPGGRHDGRSDQGDTRTAREAPRLVLEAQPGGGGLAQQPGALQLQPTYSSPYLAVCLQLQLSSLSLSLCVCVCLSQGFKNRPWYDMWCDAFRASPAEGWSRWDAAFRAANIAVPGTAAGAEGVLESPAVQQLMAAACDPQKLAAFSDAAGRVLSSRPPTLIHGDCRGDNLFRKDGTDDVRRIARPCSSAFRSLYSLALPSSVSEAERDVP